MRAITSASNLHRRIACPGSEREESKYAPPPDTEFSEEGTMLHTLFLTGQRPDTLTPEQVDCLDQADYLANRFFERVCTSQNIPEHARFRDVRECEMFYRIPGQSEPAFPGHADVIRLWPEHHVMAVVDLKTGFLEVEQAAENSQLATYAVMAHQRVQYGTIAVGIVTPRNFGPRWSSAIYDIDGIKAAEKAIHETLCAIASPRAKLVAGARQCQYCIAKPQCPAYLEKFGQAIVTRETAIDTCTNDELVRLFEGIQFAGKIEKEVKAAMKERIEAGTLPGFKLRSTGSTSEITKPLEFFTALKDAMYSYTDNAVLTASEFDAVRKVGMTDLYALVASKIGKSQAKTKEFIADHCGHLITKKDKEKSIVPEK